ncbi:excinuclease ABC subunit A [Dysgonomonas sp. PFB1-18]|uniref:excinuclease ABC subunit UvrA n=1 Tax=unclassified Dysgonomonas TaxID=2630389 RepID=UPI002474F48F|nr:MULTISPECIES: excinuclease ABC subunit UvrA [unclassified Dysgonomonas]MDH6307092.1 excinuclease ABC subunit A [Dysgonomonas sp. PF1-14]MDH6337011.1 excinuclease ABC subunit A [Dysgonomonas sp. PF1-16]MDH6380997.1 excinuclease ABC subunit A [Dysgonomonas sp. PFB1-18]MDH6396424.1 excinuclease ABC subunit A [Dysgonomonas sp. PF1-23]
MSEEKNIFIKGARVNNLKNIDVEIPRNKFVVITGLSGSGKSSLAFDTLYAEGQRRYVESLSAYARQFLGRMNKPESDFIKGIPPAIAIEQRVSSRNPRSTVGTSTEVYEYLRLLFARIGKTISPVSGQEVKKHQVSDIVAKMQTYPEDTRLAIFTKIILRDSRTLNEQLEILQKEGFSRVELDGKIERIDNILSSKEKYKVDQMLLLIDRLTCDKDAANISRFSESIETAFYEGEGDCIIRFYIEDRIESFDFSRHFEADGIEFQEPTDLMFSFNSPVGACPVCEGFGRVMGIDEDLVVPNKSLSVYEDAVMCWRGDKMSEWKNEFIHAAGKYDFPVHRPYFELTDKERDLLWHGAKGLHGIDDFFAMVSENQYKIQYRVMLARYRGKTTCPSCKGARLKPQALYVKVGGRTIADLVLMPISELREFFTSLNLDETDAAIAKRLLTDINVRIQYLMNVGLGYLTLNRLSNSLSGGESQRINLATSLGSSLVGSLYILDEPSIGLHSRDTDLLIKVLQELKGIGNTVVVVEHDEEIIRAADYIIDMGPKAGRLGGEVVYQGDVAGLRKQTESYTVRYLNGEEKIDVPKTRRKWNNYIKVKGARQNNLKNIDVKFPLNVMTVVTGVSGSGKSSLVCDVFYTALERHYKGKGEQVVQYNGLEGDLKLIKEIEMVDQNPIGRSTRSNPVTYIKAYDEIRKLFADQPLAKQLHFTPAFFSFNVEGGRCEECTGEGKILVEMQFMADVLLECEVCKGRRFKQDILDVQYKGASIYDVLEMTIDQAIEFFEEGKGTAEKKIVKRLKPLQDVGLGYVKLGQSSSSLSGGENQRVKLAFHLVEEKPEPTLFIFDEPTTGLHFHDIKTLLKAFDSLIKRGHTIVIIEHNMDVIKCADHIIDIGPEGGKEGGYIVCEGTPEKIVKCEKSYTGHFLKEKL